MVLNSEKLLLNYKSIDKIIGEHNKICQSIFEYNIFWKNYYCLLIYTLIPINAILLHQILFESLPTFVLIAGTLGFISIFGFQILINLMTASISREVTKSNKYINNFYMKYSLVINIKRKIKVIIISNN